MTLAMTYEGLLDISYRNCEKSYVEKNFPSTSHITKAGKLKNDVKNKFYFTVGHSARVGEINCDK